MRKSGSAVSYLEFPYPKEQESSLRGSYYEMLLDDIQTRIFLMCSEMRCFWTSERNYSEREIVKAFSYFCRERKIHEVFIDFAKHCVIEIMRSGHAYYEIVIDEKSPQDFKIWPIPGNTIYRKRDQIIQKVPRTMANQKGIRAKTRLDKKNFIIVQPPSYLRNDFKKIQKKLEILKQDHYQHSIHLVQNIKKQDYDYFDNLQHIILLEATKEIGWCLRQELFSEKFISDGYFLERTIRFAKFNLHLRNEIFYSLKNSLEALEIGTLNADKFSTDDDLSDILDKLRKNNSPSRDIYSLIRNIK